MYVVFVSLTNAWRTFVSIFL